jgi:hypothetical protein
MRPPVIWPRFTSIAKASAAFRAAGQHRLNLKKAPPAHRHRAVTVWTTTLAIDNADCFSHHLLESGQKFETLADAGQRIR